MHSRYIPVLLFFFVALFVSVGLGQEKSFPIGVFLSGGEDFTRYRNYHQVKEMGVNMVVQHAEKGSGGKGNLDSLAQFDYVIAWNGDREDLIHHYSSGMYTKWEAEEDFSVYRAGKVMHETGKSGKYLGQTGWQSEKNSRNKLLVYGPYYQQKKEYTLVYHYKEPVYYTAEFKIALRKIPANNIKVCSLAVSYTYFDDHNRKKEVTLGNPIVIMSGMLSDGQFHSIRYEYDYLSVTDEKVHEGDGTRFGIQFKILMLEAEAELFVDNIEVYDNYIWKEFRKNPIHVSRDILDYENSFKNANPVFYNKLTHWFSRDEPDVIDFIAPFSIIDSILINNGRKRLITEFNPSYDRFDINWDPVIKRWTEGSRTDRLLVDYYPYSDDKSGFPLELFFYHQILQDCHLQDPDFFYSIQAFGFKDFNYQSKWKWWRQPAPEEMNIALMLPLAHGAKGIIFWKYYTNMKWEGDSFSEDKIMEMDLVLWDNAAKKYVPTALWHKIKNDIAPRLKGTFGKILLKLKYTGMNSSSYSFEPGEKVAGFNYLSFSGNPDPGRKRFYDYHAGLFTDNTDPDDRYFMVVNTNPAVTGPYRLNLQSPDPRYKNFRLSNVEGGLDTTFTNKFSFILNYPPGEGFLYRLSPVVKYGGILIEDETINGIENLRGKLIISPGTALVIKGTYNLYDTIEVSEGGKLIMEDDARVNHFGGKIIYGATSKVYQELISKEKK